MRIGLAGAAFVVATCLAAPASSQVQSAESPSVKLGGPAMMRIAVIAPLPEFPVESIKAGRAGVTVLELFVSATGVPQTVEVIEAPDKAIADSTRKALLQWRFQAVSYGGKPAAVRAKLVFYFLIENGRGRVVKATGLPSTSTTAGDVAKVPVIDLREWGTLSSQSPKPVLIDIAPRTTFLRGHLNGAINIPEDEVTVRAPVELPPGSSVVIDCPSRRASYCDAAVQQLFRTGFTKVRILRRD